MEVGLGEAGDFNAPRFEEFPAEFLRGLDLAVDAVGAFVADAHVYHNYLINDLLKSSLETATTFFSIVEPAINSLSFFSYAALSIGSSTVWPISDE